MYALSAKSLRVFLIHLLRSHDELTRQMRDRASSSYYSVADDGDSRTSWNFRLGREGAGSAGRHRDDPLALDAEQKHTD